MWKLSSNFYMRKRNEEILIYFVNRGKWRKLSREDFHRNSRLMKSFTDMDRINFGKLLGENFIAKIRNKSFIWVLQQQASPISWWCADYWRTSNLIGWLTPWRLQKFIPFVPLPKLHQYTNMKNRESINRKKYRVVHDSRGKLPHDKKTKNRNVNSKSNKW